MRTRPISRRPFFSRASANTRGRGSAARSSMPRSSTTSRAPCGPAASSRRAGHAPAPPLIRVVVAIDPAATSSEHADETGIIVAGMDGQGQGWVLADVSGRYPPAEWARTAIAAYRSHRADRGGAEVNNGGEMVEATLRVIDPNVSFAAVRAARGKLTRAEPVAALYEQGRVHHLGVFPQLEDQMCGFVPADHGDFGQRPMGCSPDRADALVWALTDLLIEPMSNQGIYDLYRQLVQNP